jgi:hypothetical protein
VVTEENAKFLQEGYIDYVRAHAALGSLVVEEAVSITWYTGNKDDSGTADAYVIGAGKELLVDDLKFGMGVDVDPEDNRQCKIYAISILEAQDLWDEYETVRITIFQPRVGDGKPKEWVVSVAALKVFKEDVRKIAYAVTHTTSLPYTPSTKACRFCKAKAICPALGSLVESQMVEGFTDESKPVEAGEVIVKQTAKMGNLAELLGRRMDLCDLIELYISGVRSAVEIELLAGREVLGEDGLYKLVQGKRGNRQWSSEDEATELLKSFRLKQEDMYSMKIISPTAASKLFEKAYPRRWEKCAKIIVQSEGAKHVADAKDPRPAITTKPEDGFEDDGSDLV